MANFNYTISVNADTKQFSSELIKEFQKDKVIIQKDAIQLNFDTENSENAISQFAELINRHMKDLSRPIQIGIRDDAFISAQSRAENLKSTLKDIAVLEKGKSLHSLEEISLIPLSTKEEKEVRQKALSHYEKVREGNGQRLKQYSKNTDGYATEYVEQTKRLNSLNARLSYTKTAYDKGDWTVDNDAAIKLLSNLREISTLMAAIKSKNKTLWTDDIFSLNNIDLSDMENALLEQLEAVKEKTQTSLEAQYNIMRTSFQPIVDQLVAAGSKLGNVNTFGIQNFLTEVNKCIGNIQTLDKSLDALNKGETFFQKSKDVSEMVVEFENLQKIVPELQRYSTGDLITFDLEQSRHNVLELITSQRQATEELLNKEQSIMGSFNAENVRVSKEISSVPIEEIPEEKIQAYEKLSKRLKTTNDELEQLQELSERIQNMNTSDLEEEAAKYANTIDELAQKKKLMSPQAKLAKASLNMIRSKQQELSPELNPYGDTKADRLAKLTDYKNIMNELQSDKKKLEADMLNYIDVQAALQKQLSIEKEITEEKQAQTQAEKEAASRQDESKKSAGEYDDASQSADFESDPQKNAAIPVEPDIEPKEFVSSITSKIKESGETVKVDVEPLLSSSADFINKAKQQLQDQEMPANQADETHTLLNNEIEPVIESKKALENVTKTVNEKTNAFREEETTVNTSIKNEIGDLEKLDKQLWDIIQSLDSLSGTEVILDIKIDNTSFSQLDDTIVTTISNLQDKLNGFTGSQLLGVGEQLERIADADFAKNINKVAKAIDNLRTKIEGLDTSQTLLHDIKEIVLQGDALKSFATILQKSQRQINNAAKQAVKAGTPLPEKTEEVEVPIDIQEAITQSKELKEILGDIVSITRNTQLHKNGKEISAYKVTGTTGNSVMLDNTGEQINEKEILNIAKAWDKYDAAQKKYYQTRIALLNGKDSNINIADADNYKSEMETALNTIEHLKKLGLESPERAQHASSVQTAFESDLTMLRAKNKLIAKEKKVIDALRERIKLESEYQKLVAQQSKNDFTPEQEKWLNALSTKRTNLDTFINQSNVNSNKVKELKDELSDTILKAKASTSKLGQNNTKTEQKLPDNNAEKNLNEQISAHNQLYKIKRQINLLDSEKTSDADAIKNYEQELLLLNKKIEKLKEERQLKNYSKLIPDTEYQQRFDTGVYTSKKLFEISGSKETNDVISATEQQLEAILRDKGSIAGFSQPFAKAQEKITELNKSFRSGKIGLQQYQDDVARVGISLKQIVDVVNTNDVASARIAMIRYLESLSDGDVTIKSFNSSTGKMTAELKGQSGILRNVALTYDQVSGSIRKVTDAQKTQLSGMKQFFVGLKHKFGDMAKYYASFVGLEEFFHMGSQGFNYIKDYDTGITELKKVTDESTEVLEAFGKEAYNIGKSVGSTGTAMISSAADWSRLGESIQEAAESARVANTLLKVSEFSDISEATDAMISMSQAYKELSKTEIMDVLNNIGNNFSIDTAGLATGLQESAAALKTANNTMNEAVALITAGNQITQDPSQTGAGIRTIALRIQGTEVAKQQLADLGENVDDFVVATSSKLDSTVRSLTAVESNNFKGIGLLDDNGNYRSTYRILQDIADIYTEIQQVDKKYGTQHEQALLELLAGKNRSNIAASILQNGNVLRDVYESAQNSEGSAQKELDTYLESIEAHITTVQSQWEKLWTQSGTQNFIKLILDLASAFLELTNQIGLVPAAFGTATAAVYAKYKISEAVKNEQQKLSAEASDIESEALERETIVTNKATEASKRHGQVDQAEALEGHEVAANGINEKLNKKDGRSKLSDLCGEYAISIRFFLWQDRKVCLCR